MNQQVGDSLSAREAAEFLGIKLQTLYAYASRGLLTSSPGAQSSRARRYARVDLERLRARQRARSGHGPVAAGALDWGDPVLTTRITELLPNDFRYRGQSALDLARADTPYESVAELLWTGVLPESTPRWQPDRAGAGRGNVASLLPTQTHPLPALALSVAAYAAQDPARFDAPAEFEHVRARALLMRMAAALSFAFDPQRAAKALYATSVAEAVAMALDARNRKAHVAINRALVLCADHELNASTFAARVAASTGADLYACVGAGLAALSGPRHGGVCDRIEALIAEAAAPERAATVVHERFARGETVPGFGHPIYPDGDPRAPLLIETAQRIAPRSRALRIVTGIVDAMAAAGHPPPTSDMGLIAVAAALGLPFGAAAGIFAVGRTAGWIAHALEQRESGAPIRPRARFVG